MQRAQRRFLGVTKSYFGSAKRQRFKRIQAYWAKTIIICSDRRSESATAQGNALGISELRMQPVRLQEELAHSVNLYLHIINVHKQLMDQQWLMSLKFVQKNN